MEREKREYRADELKLKRLRAQFALTVEQFCGKSGLDKATARKLFKGTPVTLTTLLIAAKVFGVTDHLELLHPEELLALGVEPAVTVAGETVQEWQIETYLSPWEKTANGLQYHVARLRHRFLPSRLARGKCYELRHLPVAERQRLEDHLRRHAEVCERVGRHPNVAENVTATFVENGGLWWVLDRFEDGTTLAERLTEGPLEGTSLKTVVTGIAAGLDALHREKIVRRELSPRFVLLRKKDLTQVLTDFELAKLLDGVPTVSPVGGWPDDPYLAEEVVSRGTVDGRADLYSWGRVFVHCLTGRLPEPGADADAVRNSTLPATVREVLVSCLALPKSDRPASYRSPHRLSSFSLSSAYARSAISRSLTRWLAIGYRVTSGHLAPLHSTEAAFSEVHRRVSTGWLYSSRPACRAVSAGQNASRSDTKSD